MTFLDLTGSFSAGLDTLGLDWRNGFAVGAVVDTGMITVAAEYISGHHIVTDEEIEGYQLWTKVDVGRFSPFIQYQNSRKGDDDREKTRIHFGTAFLLKEEVKLRLQATQVADKDEDGHTEISMSIFARF